MTGDCHVRFCESRGVRFPPATHQDTPAAKWLGNHPRVHMHYTPTYASWLNQVELFFGMMTAKQSAAAPTAQSRPWRKTFAIGSTPGTKTPTVHLDQDRRRDPRTPQLISSTDSWRRTLETRDGMRRCR